MLSLQAHRGLGGQLLIAFDIDQRSPAAQVPARVFDAEPAAAPAGAGAHRDPAHGGPSDLAPLVSQGAQADDRDRIRLARSRQMRIARTVAADPDAGAYPQAARTPKRQGGGAAEPGLPGSSLPTRGTRAESGAAAAPTPAPISAPISAPTPAPMPDLAAARIPNTMVPAATLAVGATAGTAAAHSGHAPTLAPRPHAPAPPHSPVPPETPVPPRSPAPEQPAPDQPARGQPAVPTRPSAARILQARG